MRRIAKITVSLVTMSTLASGALLLPASAATAAAPVVPNLKLPAGWVVQTAPSESVPRPTQMCVLGTPCTSKSWTLGNNFENGLVFTTAGRAKDAKARAQNVRASDVAVFAQNGNISIQWRKLKKSKGSQAWVAELSTSSSLIRLAVVLAGKNLAYGFAGGPRTVAPHLISNSQLASSLRKVVTSKQKLTKLTGPSLGLLAIVTH